MRIKIYFILFIITLIFFVYTVSGEPAIISQWNSVTSFDNHTLINTSSAIEFNVTFNQIGTITWYKDDIKISTINNAYYTNYLTSWDVPSSSLKKVTAKITNSNGTSEVNWYILVYNLLPATVAYIENPSSYNSISVSGGSIDLPSIFNKLNNRSIFDYVDNKTFFLNSTKYSSDAVGTRLKINSGVTLYINDTTSSEFRLVMVCDAFCDSYKNSRFSEIYINPDGALDINNTKITSWNTSSSNAEYNHSNVMDGAYRIVKPSISTAPNSNAAVNITNSEIYWLGGYSGTKGIILLNVRPYILNNLFYGVNQINLDNIPSNSTIDKNTFKNSYSNSLRIINSNNFTINNNNFINTSIGTSNTLEFMNCSYGIINNNTIDNTYWANGWNGIQLGSASHHMIIRNSRFIRTNHNGIDLRNNVNYTTIIDSTFENFTASGANALIITMNSNYDGGAYHTLLKNITVSNISSGKAIQSWESSDITIENMTVKGTNYAFYISEINNFNIRDSIITKSTLSDRDFNIYWDDVVGDKYIHLNSSIYALNTNIQNDGSILINSKNETLTSYNYLDVVVKDSSGNPLENATIMVTADRTPYPIANDFSIITQTTTDSSGHNHFSSEDSTELLLVDFIKTYGNKTNYNYTITILKDALTTKIYNIDPDSSWYRPDPNTPTYTITAIIPDAGSTTGLHLTGFAPSESNPFTPGQPKKFVVWTDQILTSMKWYVDGVQVTSSSLNYSWTAASGSHVIEFMGSNANGSVNKVWNVGPGVTALPTANQSSSGGITGKSIDVNQTPVLGANISMFKVGDTLVKSVLSGDDGRFEFSNVSNGSYYVLVNLSSYGFNRSQEFNITANNTTNIGNLTIIDLNLMQQNMNDTFSDSPQIYDINGDGYVNVCDAVYLMKMVFGLSI